MKTRARRGVPSSKIDRAFDLERRQRPRDWWHKAAPYITLVFRQHPQRAQQRECLLVLVVLLVRWWGAGRACARCPPLARERYSCMRRMQLRHPAQRKASAIDSAALANLDQRTQTYSQWRGVWCIAAFRLLRVALGCASRTVRATSAGAPLLSVCVMQAFTAAAGTSAALEGTVYNMMIYVHSLPPPTTQATARLPYVASVDTGLEEGAHGFL